MNLTISRSCTTLREDGTLRAVELATPYGAGSSGRRGMEKAVMKALFRRRLPIGSRDGLRRACGETARRYSPT